MPSLSWLSRGELRASRTIEHQQPQSRQPTTTHTIHSHTPNHGAQPLHPPLPATRHYTPFPLRHQPHDHHIPHTRPLTARLQHQFALLSHLQPSNARLPRRAKSPQTDFAAAEG